MEMQIQDFNLKRDNLTVSTVAMVCFNQLGPLKKYSMPDQY